MKTQGLILEAMRASLQYRLENSPLTPGLHFASHLLNHQDGLDLLYEKLDDEESTAVLDWIISYRVIESLTSKDVALDICAPSISNHRWNTMARQAAMIPERDLKENIEVDVIENYILDGYNLPGKCEVRNDDVVLDVGAFNGNSAIALGRHARDGIVYAFEPNPDTRKSFMENVVTAGLKNFELVPKGVGAQEGVVRFARGGAGSRIDEGGDIEVSVTTIDDFVLQKGLGKVDFIKFDIEGFEASALKGAKQTIKHFRPKLAVSAYHLHGDLFELPKLINSFSRWYKMYLRHNANYDGEFVLFCSPS